MTIKVEREIKSDEMHDLEQGKPLAQRHAGLVFDNEESAEKRDMNKTLGRFEPEHSAIAFFDDHSVGTKYRALYRNGYGLYLKANKDGNYFVDTSPIKGVMEQVNEAAKQREVDLESLDFEPMLVDEQEFFKHDNDGAVDITFTTPQLKHEHRLGLLNASTGRYTLRPDLINELDDFEYSLEEHDGNVYASIAPTSIAATKLVKLLDVLKQEDVEEINEDIERDKVYAPALSGIKSMLKALQVAKRLGDVDAVTELAKDIEQELGELEQGDVDGADEVRAEIQRVTESVVKKVGRAAKKQAGKARSAASSVVNKSRDNQMRSAESIKERWIREDNQRRAINELLGMTQRRMGLTTEELIEGALQ